MADIYINAGGRVYRLPFIPEEMPEISVAARNEEFATYQDGVYNLLVGIGLREMTLEGVLPGRDYSFSKSGVRGKEFMAALEKAIAKKKPIRVVLGGRVTVNMQASVESLAWHENRAGNIVYSAALKEYRNV